MQTRAKHDAHLAEVAAQVDSADRQRRGGATGTADAAVTRACRAIVARRRDDERVEPCGTGGRTSERVVGERRERLGDADERNASRVVRVAVGIRVDGALEPGEHLIGSRVDGPARSCVALPARDADRQQRRSRRNAGHAAGAARPDDEPCHLGPVPLELRRLVRPCCGESVGTADDVDPRCDAPAQERMRTVDARVEQRDRHAAAVDVRQPDLRSLSGFRAAEQARSD